LDMNYRNTHEFPQWVKDFNYWHKRNGWPKEWQPIADAIYAKAEEVGKAWKGKNKDICPISQEEVDNKMGAQTEYYESYRIFCCNKGFRPDEWDYLCESKMIHEFSRTGSASEAKIGDWYFVMGLEYD